MVVLIEDEDWSGVVIPYSLRLVVVVVDTVEVYLRMVERAILGELFVLPSEFLATVAMG